MKVVATNKFKELSVKPLELDYTPDEGEIFEVSDIRFNVLNGNNSYGVVFVKEHRSKEDTSEKLTVNEEIATKKVNKKKK